MPAELTDFATLLERARRGDNDALVELVRLYEADVRIVARTLLGPALRPHFDSLDLVQSVHRSLLVGLRHQKFDLATPQQLIALAAEMVRRKVGRKWRHLRRQQRLSHGPGQAEDLAQLLKSLTSSELDPARAAQLDDAIEHLCGNLNARDRRLMELRLQGYSTVETARKLGEDADVLRAHLSRLRRQLRAAGILSEWL